MMKPVCMAFSPSPPAPLSHMRRIGEGESGAKIPRFEGVVINGIMGKQVNFIPQTSPRLPVRPANACGRGVGGEGKF